MIRLTMNLKPLFILGFIAHLTSACSQTETNGKEDPASKSTSTNTTESEGSKPSDSTGVASPIDLQFSTQATASALHLAATTMDLGNGVILSDARVNIGAIKLKPQKDEDDDEKALEKELKSKESELKKDSESDEDGFETQMSEIKSKYEALISDAASEADKKALETQREAEKDAIEAQVAEVKKAQEDKLEAIKDAKDASIKWKGPYIYDLIADTVTPALEETTILDGSYRRIAFELRPNRSLDASDPLLNYSIYLAGTVDIGGTATSFSLSFPYNEKFKMFSTKGAAMEPGVSNKLVIAFKPVDWFAGIDFSTATKDAAGSIVIDDKSNLELLNAIKKNIKSSTHFGKDNDGDGKLKDDESDGDGKEAVEQEEAEKTDASETAESEK